MHFSGKHRPKSFGGTAYADLEIATHCCPRLDLNSFHIHGSLASPPEKVSFQLWIASRENGEGFESSSPCDQWVPRVLYRGAE